MSKRQSKTPLIYALEPRLLFDGDLGADVASAIVYRDGSATDTAPAVAPENQRETQRENISFEFHSTRSAIVFIDGGVEDPQTLADAAADVLPDDAQIHILDGDSDGFAQINDILQNHDRVDEIHIFGHGTAGEARLGTASLSLETLTTHSDTMAVLKHTLTEDGDILLYGCNIAAGDNGQTFIEELAELTAADIAASDDITGAGGDWELEVTTGPIETETVIVSEYLGRLSNGVSSTTRVAAAHSAIDLESGAGHGGDGLGIQITQEQTGIQTDADLNFNLGSNLTNDASLQLDTYLVYRNTGSGNSGSARIVFDNGIAGINWVDWRSDDSGLLDAQFAKTGASYDDLPGRGLESVDRQNVSFSGRALNITGTGLAGDTNGDYMRVFVYSSPASITAVNDAESVSESVKVEAGAYEAAANIDLTTNDTTTTSSKRVVGLGSASDNINENPSHLDIGSLGLSAITGVYGELRVASDNTISYWVTDDAALETALANNASVTETFYYRVANEFGSEDDGEITITINQANDRPVANPYTITRDYDSAGFTIGTSSAGHPLVSGGVTDADDSGPFVFSGIHADTSSAITLSDVEQEITIANFGTVTVNANDELVFTPHDDLADLPQGQSLSRSFIYFVSDDGGAYNEGSDGVDRSDKITITINGTANIPIAQVSDVARFYFENKNNQDASGSSMGGNELDLLNPTVFSYSASPNAHAQHNLQNGSLIDDLWTVEGAGNTIVFDAWTDADGNDLSYSYGGYSAVTSSNGLPGAKITTFNQLDPPGNYANFDEDGNLDEGDTGTYTWYYRVNVVNDGDVISSAIGQLDVTLEGTNDAAYTSVSLNAAGVSDETNGTRITTPVTQTVNIYDYIQDADDLDTIRADKITIEFVPDHTEENAALLALSGQEFTLLRGETTDDANWDQAAAWGELANHFSFTFNENGTIDWVSKRDQFRSDDGYFRAVLTNYTEISGRSDVSDVSHTDENLVISKFNYSPNVIEFIDDSVAVNSSANGAGSVNGNDAFFSSLASFQRSTGSYNVRVAAGETIVGEYITLTMDADGDYTYTVNQGAFDALGDGETASESFTYWGASNPNAGDAIGQATLTFNLTGLADAFVAVDDTARVVTGATISGSSGDLGNQSSVSVYESSGTLISNDINDVGDLTVVGVWLGQETINATPTTIPPGGNVQVNGTYGVLTIYANGGYDYVANSGVTSEETEYFTYTVRNGDGEDDTAELAITILPAADNEFVVEDLSHTMNDIADEAGLTKTVTIANLLTHDANAIRSGNEDGASYAITGYAAGDSGSGFSNVGDTIRGTYGTLTISAAGVPTYVFDRPYSLKASERGYDVFTFEVTDGRGSPTTNTAQLTVQINGRNTTPSWSDDAAITITEDTGVTLTKYDDLAAQGSNNATGYNTALTGGWVNYLEDEFGDVDGYQFSKFDNASVDRSSYSTTEGWTSWRMTSGNFPDGKIGASTNQNTILIGSVPFGNNNTDDRITVDNTIQVGQSDVFNVSGELTGNINIRGTFDVTVIGVQNTPVVDLDDDSATEPTIFRFGNFYQGRGGGRYPTNTVDLFSNDTTSDYSNILRIEISADGASGWTPISQDSDGNAAPAVGASILSGSDFYWRGDKYYAGESYIEFSPSNFEALPAGDDVTGSFYYRIVEVDGTTSSAAQVSATLTPTDDPPEVHRQGAVLDGSGSGIDSSGSISVGASDQPNWNNNDGRGLAKPPSGVSNFYEMGNNGDDGDGVSIEEVDMPGEHTGGLLDQSNSTSSADPEDDSVILSVTPRYVDGATTYELSGLGNNSSTSVTLRGNHGELTVNEDGSYSYTADFKAALNWSYSSGYEYYDYVDSFDIELGPTGVGGAGSVTTTLDIFFDGTDGAPVASDDTAHVREDAAAINVSGNEAASTAGGDDDNAVDAPGEHSGNLLANDTDVNPNANLRIVAAGNGNTLWAMSLGTVDNPYAQIAGTYGTLSIYQDGSYTYAANDDAADVLAAGETSNDVFRYRVSDNNNDYGNADLTITVHGTANETYDRDVDTDENTPYSFVHTIENNVITATDFYASDADYSAYNPPIIITSLPHAGTLKLSGVDVVLTNGTKTISGDDLGDLSYVPPDDTHGDDFTYFTYEIQTDSNDDALSGITITMTIDINPDPNNAAPTITDPTAVVASIAEIADGTTGETTADIEASGSFTIADGDSDSVSVSVTSSSTTRNGGAVLGTLTPTVSNNTDDGAGVVTWSYAINDSHLDTMAVSDSFTETFTLTIDDGNGGTVTQDIVITVNGTNDAPVAQADSAAVAERQTINVADGQGDDYTDPVTAGTSTGDVLHTAAASHADSDVDGDTLRVSAIAPVGGDTLAIASGASVQVNGAHGVLTMYGHGGYDYTANRNVTSAGATETDSFTYTVSDDNGGTTTASLQITITDVPNNPPTIEVQTSVTGSVTELDDPDAAEETTDLTTSGSFTIADLDNDGVILTVAETGTTYEGSPVLGALTATVDNDTAGDGSGVIVWNYTIANSDIGGLDVGQSFSETFTITVADAYSGSVTQDVTVTVNGANDVPDIQNDSYTVIFGNTLARDAANGVLANDSDDDDQDVLIVDAAAVSAVDFNTVASGADMTELAGTYGSLTIDTDGSFTYTPDANNAALQALDGTETVTETFYIDVHDGNATNIGAGGRNVNQVDIVISGVNDAPVAVDDVISVTVGTPATGNIIDPDINADDEAGEDSDADGDTLTVTQYQTNGGGAGTLGQALQGVYGTLLISADGSYTYTVDETNAQVIAWGPGDPVLTETFNYTISDTGSETDSAVITVNVTGVNDPPEADPIVETRTKNDEQFIVNLVTDANATDIDDGDVLVAINDGDDSDDEPIATFTRTGTTRVMVTADSGLYLIDGAAVASGGFALNPGRTYIFDWSGATDHPVRLSETADGTHGGGEAYTTGVTVEAVAGTTTIVVSDTTPTTLYAYCENHAAMGFGTPVEAYDVPDSSYTLSGSTLTVDPQVFADLASDNEVEIAIAYKIADGDVADDATYVIDNTATITITGLNTKPQIIDNYNDGINDNDVANVADVTTPEDTTYVFTLGDFNYVDQDNNPMASVLITQGPLLGELTLNDVVITDPVSISRADIEAGLLKYTPPADENGNDYTAFSYAVNDGKVDSDVGAMTIHVTPVNDPPEADPIVETRTKNDEQFIVNLVTDANATDIDDGDVLVAINDGDDSDDEPIATFTRTGTTRVMVTADSGLYLIDGAAVASGGFALNPGRTYIFDWSGATDHPVRLSETADGTHGGGEAYTTGVTVEAVAGTTTIVVSDTTPTTLYAYCENHAAMGFGTPVEAYDVPDSSYTLSGSTLTVDPQVFADLASDNEVEIAIAYKIADGDVADDATYVIDNTATITITGLNTKPQIIDNYNDGINDNDVANVADVTTPEDTTYVFTLGDFNYVDQDNNPMASVLITQGPLLGELTLNDVVITDPVSISRADIEAGLLKYTPPADENGNDYTAFSYAVNDGKVDSDVGAMTIHVTPVNDPPQSADKFVRILGERTVQFGGNEFSFRDTDDGDTLNHITLMSLPSKGVLYLVPYGTVLPAIIDPPMDPSWAITDIAGADGRDILKAELSSLIYVANETVKTQSYDAFTFTVNDGSQRVPGPLDSEKSNQITLGKVIYFEPRIDPESKEPAKKDRVKPKEKRPELNPHDLPPVLKVAVNLDENRQLRNEPILNAVGGRELGEIGDDNAGLADDSWMNAKTSMQPDISGNIRVIDLKVEGREIAVQITDEASDRAERFKGELPDGSPLPSWVKVDQKTGLTIADPPPGTQPFEMRVVAEDGAGNARAIDLVLDPTLIAGEGEANTEPANDKVANNAASDSVSDSKDDAISAIVGDNPASQPNVATRGNNLSSSTVDVLSDGSVVFDETATLAPNGSLRLLRMVNENDGVKIEINDDAQESATRYEVRQKDGSAAPDWVKVDVRTGELTIEAPQNIDAIELTIIALDGGEERRLDVDVDLDETPVQPLDDGQDAGQDDLKGDDDQTSEGSADKQRSANALPVNEFVPLDAQIDKALSESSYGRDIQQAAQSLS